MRKREITTMGNFFLRTNKDKGIAKLYYRLRRKNISVTVRTRIQVGIESWHKAIQSASAWYLYTCSEGKTAARLMKEITDGVDALFLKGDPTEEMIVDVIRRTEELKEKNQSTLNEGLHHILQFYDFIIAHIDEGVIRPNHRKKYSERSVMLWHEFEPCLKGYCTPEQTFQDIDRLFIDGFRNYLEQKGYMETTINGHISHFRKLCKMAHEFGVNDNLLSLNGWKSHRAKKDEKKTAVYLTEEELDALYDMPLDDELAETRDLFFLGYLTCQRYSDYNNLDASNFIINSEGVPVIALYQKKTGTYVEIPRTDKRIDAICRRYQFQFPRLRRKQTNERLKIIFYRLAQQVPSLNKKYVTKLSLAERRAEETYRQLLQKKAAHESFSKSEHTAFLRLSEAAQRRGGMPLYERNEKGEVIRPKYELVSTHTSRRSRITNYYKRGILDDRQMMAISGHQTTQIFEEYIKIGPAEQARRIFDKLTKTRR